VKIPGEIIFQQPDYLPVEVVDGCCEKQQGYNHPSVLSHWLLHR